MTRHHAFAALLLLLLCAVVEGMSRLALPVAAHLGADVMTVGRRMELQRLHIDRLLDEGPTVREQLDPDLGWTYRPGFSDGRDRINSRGLRSDRDYAEAPDPGVMRIAAFGDSFTYGNEVANGQEWPARVEAMAPGMEVMNFGVGGYGADQAFLRFLRDGRNTGAEYAVLGFPPVDMRRAVNVYRQFLQADEWPVTKPRFVLDDAGGLVLIPNPLRNEDDYRRLVSDPQRLHDLGTNDYWYRRLIYANPLFDALATVRLGVGAYMRIEQKFFHPDRMLRGPLFNSESEAFRVNVAIFAAFADSARAAGMTPLVLLLPDPETLDRTRRGRARVYDPVIAALIARAVPVLDAADAFTGLPAADAAGWFAPFGHYSPSGNDIIARWLVRCLAEPDGYRACEAAARP